MTVAFIVTGLGFGDEGKGATVDYLARQRSTVVVRHNGGPQAEHNVIDRTRHHTFSQFGSGTLAGAKTFLSRFMLVNPLNMMREAAHLADIGETTVWSRMHVDQNCVIVTPFHVAVNRLLETARGDNRHGSTGQGVGVTRQLTETRPDLTIKVKDITSGDIRKKLDDLRRQLLDSAPWPEGDPNQQILADEWLPEYLAGRYQEWAIQATVVPSEHLAALARDHEQLVFEGAQGVLLDENYGFHPYTTWATTTHEHAQTLIREIEAWFSPGDPTSWGPSIDVTRLGVIRAVTTRHGPGPLPTEDHKLTAAWYEPHNTDGRWQGPFRVGHLDLMAHSYATRVCGGIDHVVVTHLDKACNWRYCIGYEDMLTIPLGRRGDLSGQEQLTAQLQRVTPQLRTADNQDDLLSMIETVLGAPIGIISDGPTAKHRTTLSLTEVAC